MKNRIFSPLTPSGGIGKVILVVMMVFVDLLATMDVTAQRVRTTAVFDGDTSTRPKAGFYGVGVKSGNAYLVPQAGNNVRLANYSLFTGLTTNYLTKWNGSKLVNSAVFDNGGNVGVGMASPSAKLHVLSSSGTVAMIESSTSQAFYGLKSNTGGVVYFGNNNGGDFTIQTAGSGYSDKLYITSSGSVGIGTTSPSAKLHVVGDAWIRQSDASYLRMTSNPTTANINFNNTTGLSFAYNDGSDLMRITAAGNVGIGTTSPSYKLDVNGTIHAGAVGTNIRMRSDGTSSNDSFLGVDGSGIMYIANWDANRGFRISNTGNINVIGSGSLGVGTTSPTSKLQVVGLPTYADNTAATSGGLTAGAFYRTSTGVLMVVY